MSGDEAAPMRGDEGSCASVGLQPEGVDSGAQVRCRRALRRAVSASTGSTSARVARVAVRLKRGGPRRRYGISPYV